MTRELHNMSVPPTSTIALQRASLPGRRFRVDLRSGVAASRLASLERWLARQGWRAAWGVLDAAGAAPAPPSARCRRARPTREALDRHLESALSAAGVPPSVGVFVDDPADGGVPLLGAAAALAVLSRRSGPLYLPTRRFEPSLARLSSTVIFFPSDPLEVTPPRDGAAPLQEVQP